jgi:hypothetical protein
MGMYEKEFDNLAIKDLSGVKGPMAEVAKKLLSLAESDFKSKLAVRVDAIFEAESKFSRKALDAAIDWISSGKEIKSFSFIYSLCERVKSKIKQLDVDPLLAVCLYTGKPGMVSYDDVKSYYQKAKYREAFMTLLCSGHMNDALALRYDASRRVFMEEEISLISSLPSFVEDVRAALEKAGTKGNFQTLESAFKRIYKKGKGVLYKPKAKPEELCAYAIGKWPDGWLMMEDFGKFRVFAEELVYKDILLPSTDKALWDMLAPHCMVHEKMLVFRHSVKASELKRLCAEMKSWGSFVPLENAHKKAKKMFVGPLAESREMLAKALEEHSGAQVIGGYICFEPIEELSKKAAEFVADRVVATEEEVLAEFKGLPREVLDGAISGSSLLKKNGCFALGSIAGKDGEEIEKNIREIASGAPVSKQCLAEHLIRFYPKFALQKGLSESGKILAAVCFAFDGFKISGDCLEVEGAYEAKDEMALAFDD